MQYIYLGASGLKVSRICLGAMSLGDEADEPASIQILDTFVSAGGNFIDTADVYSNGNSESIIGRWLDNQRRDDLIIATKVRYATGDRPNDGGLGRKHILAAVEASLRRLRTDYIDLYQIHCWDVGTPLEETLSTLDTLVRSGKIRYAGLSNFTSWQMQKAIDICRYQHFSPLISLQALYNVLDRFVEQDILPVCENEGLGLLCWSPMAAGWLTGQFHRGMERPPVGSRVELAGKHGWSESWDNYAGSQTWDVIDELLAISKEIDRSPAQVALAWLLAKPGVSCPVMGVRDTTLLLENLSCTELRLEEEHLLRLNQVSELTVPRYPHRFINRFNPPRRMREIAG